MSFALPPPLEDTRLSLINAAFLEIYEHGYEGAGLNAILRRAKVAKGSLYHYFKNKRDLCQQAIEANLNGFLEMYWLGPFRQHEDPIDGLRYVVDHFLSLPEDQRPKACPIHKLSAEFDGKDEAFRGLLNGLIEKLRQTVSDALANGQTQGLVRPFIDPKGAAITIVAMASGVLPQLRLSDDPAFTETCRRAVLDYLEGLRP